MTYCTSIYTHPVMFERMHMISRRKDTGPVWLCHLIVAITNFPFRHGCEIYHSTMGNLPAMSTGWSSLLFHYQKNASKRTWCNLFCLVRIRILTSEFYHISVFTLYILRKGRGETMFAPLCIGHLTVEKFFLDSIT